MKASEIITGETYFFVATDSPVRKHLEGTPFTVVEKKPVWRRQNKKSKRVNRFFNADGIGARADELEPMELEVVVQPRPDSDYKEDDGLPF